MGLWRGKVQSIFMGFYILHREDDKEASTYQRKKWEIIYPEAQRPSSWTWGLTS
jgi:hypothetical protein